MSSNVIFNGLTPLGFFDRYPVVRISYTQAPAPAPTLKDKVKRVFGVTPPAPPPRITGDPIAAQGIVAKDKREVYGTFSHDTTAFGQLTSANSDVPVKINLTSQAPGVEVFFLPYQNDQNFRTTLVDKQGMGADFFLTDLVDGCSVYVEGTRAAPTVYHINAVSTVAPPVAPPANQAAANWAAKYAKMDDRFRKDALKLPVGPNGSRLPKRVKQLDRNLLLPGKLENHNYMVMPAQSAAFEATLGALQLAGRAPQNLAGQTVDEMALIATQGTVFGAKNAGLWTFYAQRRALVEYFHVPGPPHPRASLGRQWIVRDCLEFWPNANTGTQLASIW